MNLEDVLSGLGGRILGINPPVYDFAWFDLWAKPAGLLGVLGGLRERGCETYLVDCLHEGRTERLTGGRWRVRRELASKPTPYAGIPRNYWRFGMSRDAFGARLASLPRPDLVLVGSIMTYWYPGVFEAIETVRRVLSGVPIGLGGIYATLCPRHAATAGADFVAARCTFPRAKILPLDLYDEPTYAVVSTSYGCPMRCSYCASSLLNPVYERRPLDEILADLAFQLSIPGVCDAAFYDDALLASPEGAILSLCARIRERWPGVRLHTPNGLHVSMLSRLVCRALHDTGFETIRLSLEGVDAYTRGSSSGKTNVQDFVSAVEELHAAGYSHDRIETYILVGLPGQRADDVERSISFARSLGVRVKLAEYAPIPGTPLFEDALAATPELSTEPLLHNNTVYVQYVAGKVSTGELQRLKDLTRLA